MTSSDDFPDYSRAYRVEQYRNRHTPRPARLPLCVQAEYPLPRLNYERVTVDAREKLSVQFVGEGDPDSKPFDVADYVWQLGEPFAFTMQVPLEASPIVAETARILEDRGILSHAFADWPKLDSAH
jgi:hypothetical protein